MLPVAPSHGPADGVVLEGGSARKPVVVTQIGGPNEYVEHETTGLKIFPTVDSVTWGLSTMFSDFDRARWMGENGRRTVEARCQLVGKRR